MIKIKALRDGLKSSGGSYCASLAICLLNSALYSSNESAPCELVTKLRRASNFDALDFLSKYRVSRISNTSGTDK